MLRLQTNNLPSLSLCYNYHPSCTLYITLIITYYIHLEREGTREFEKPNPVQLGGGRFWGLTAILAGMGRPVPVPPQLLQPMRPEPAHVLHPTSPSDQREQMQVTRPVPLQVGQRGKGPAMGFWLLSMTDFTRTAPASTLRPVASWVNTTGPIGFGRERKEQREKEEEEWDSLSCEGYIVVALLWRMIF